MQDDQEQKQPIEVEHITVNPDEAGWQPLLAFNSKWKYRVFFQKHPAAMANSMNLMDLRYFLEDHCGQEDDHWVVEACPEPTRFTVQGEDEETMKRGNSAYLTDMGWLLSMKLNSVPGDDSLWSKITIIETREGV